MRPRILVFASGNAKDGGSGFEKLVEASRGGPLDAEVVGVASNHEHGGVRARADRLGIPFYHFAGPWTAEQYRELVSKSEADFSVLSGWLKKAAGLDPAKTINIHPGPVPEFGGKGMYGHHVHEAVVAAYRRGEITHSAICMHFVTEEYDRGPVFFRFNVRVREDDTPDSLARRVNKFEHHFQPKTTSMVVNRQIMWSGMMGEPVMYPRWYEPVLSEK